MTRTEFDAWLEAHYTELLKVARRRTNTDADAAEVLHNAIAGALAGGWFQKSAKPWSRMVLAVRSYAARRRAGDTALHSARRTIFTASRASQGRKTPMAPRAE
jgi:DNA-directed RNA polymerase specialized sigma24 family protein